MRSIWKWCMPLFVLLLCLSLGLQAHGKEKPQAAIQTTVAVRSGPSETAGIIGWLADGQAVTVLGSKHAYYQIDCYDMTGFVHKQLVESDGERFFISVREGADTLGRQPMLPAGKLTLLQQRLVKTALSLRGVPYVWGGTTPRGFDCSGFTQYVYNQNGLALPRSCSGQFRAGVIVAKEDLRPGDLILFQNTGSATGLSHVGMYVGDGKLIHAGSKGITVVELANGYFTRHYLCARRILPEESVPKQPTEGPAEILFAE